MRNLVVDGSDGPDREVSVFQGDGEFPPFVVFDVNAQENLPGEFETREEAEQARAAELAKDREKVREAFDALSICAYYGMELRHQLATNPAAMAAAETLLAELRKSTMLGDRMEGAATA